MRNRNRVLLFAIAATVLPVLAPIAVRDGDEWIMAVGSAIGRTGTVLLVWLQILGFRGLVGRLFPDWLWVSRVHRTLAISAVLFIGCHPLFMAAGSGEPFRSFLFGGLADPEQLYLTLGKLALVIMALAWFSSVALRNRLGFRAWKRLHLVNYLSLPLVLLHSINVGSSLVEGPMRSFWYVLAAITAAIVVARVLYHGALVGQAAYEVVEVAPVTHDTTRVTLLPFSRALRPVPGQFIYLQTHRLGEAHPFTVSHFDEEFGAITITAKRLGPFTRRLAWLGRGHVVFVDGPYGVFTREALTTDRSIVLIAGGIGITPFLSLLRSWRERRAGDGRDVVLFYGNKTLADIAYKQDLERLSSMVPGARVIHVLSHDRDIGGNGRLELGYVDHRVLSRYLEQPLGRYEYFVCGPPPMMDGVTRLLRRHGAPRRAIHTERFAV